MRIGSATAAVRSRVNPELLTGAGLLGLFNLVGFGLWCLAFGLWS